MVGTVKRKRSTRKSVAKIPTATQKKIYLVDDHPAFRMGLKAILESVEGMVVCGEAANAREALDGIMSSDADLVITDISMPGRSGLELIKDLKSIMSKVRTLAMSMHEDSVYAMRVIQAGGHGYLNKDSSGEEISNAIQRIFEGQMIFRPEQLVHRPPNLPEREKSGTVEGVEFLTDRELEVFELLGHGNSTKEIALQLSISVKTAEVHRTNIRRKLAVKNSAELSHAAYRWVYEGEMNFKRGS
tara:strand:- start:331 stop:1062 length:732 start_codon:yes stop_codon:yes gene_type:complete